MIDIERYPKAKTTGMVSITNVEDGRYLTFRRFSVEDGSEVTPENQLIDVEKLKKEQVYLATRLDAVTMLLEDLT